MHLAAALLLAAWPAAGQTEPQPTIRSTAEEVVLDVVVRDKKGRPVRDLQASDFQVFDNGVERPVSSVRLMQGREIITREAGEVAAPEASGNNALRQVRLVTLVFDRLAEEGRRLAREAALNLVRSAREDNVYFGVVVIDQSARVVQEFSTDRGESARAIERVTNTQYTDFAATGAALRSSLERQMQPGAGTPAGEPAGTSAPVQNAGGAAGAAGIAASMAAGVDARLMQSVLDMMDFADRAANEQAGHASVDGLMALVQAQARLPGRKTVIYFSEGLRVPPALTQRFETLIGSANRANVSFYAVDARGLIAGRMNAAADARLQRGMWASRQSVTRTEGPVTIDEVRAHDTAEEAMRSNVQQALGDLAEQTGGFLVANTNDFRVPLRRVQEEIGTYYELMYRPGIEVYDGSFRKVSVRVRRPGVATQSRSGYFAVPTLDGRSPVLPFELPLLRALSAPSLPRELEYSAAALQLEPERSVRGRAVLVMEIPLRSLRFNVDEEKGSYSARLSVLALVKDSEGTVVDKFSRDLPLDGTRDRLDAVRGATFTFREPFLLAAGRYTIETAVGDVLDKRAGARRSVFVMPAARGLALSQIAVVRSVEPATGAAGTDPLRYRNGRITPALNPVIHRARGAQLSLFVTVSVPTAAAAEPVRLTVEYLHEGRVAATAAFDLPEPDGGGRIPYVVSSAAEDLPEGNVEIRVVATQGTASVEQRTVVSVR